MTEFLHMSLNKYFVWNTFVLLNCIVFKSDPPAILHLSQAHSDGAPSLQRGDALQPANTAPTLP